MASKYQWQGEPVEVIFGTSKIEPNKAKPLYWYNYDCSLSEENAAHIAAVKIKTADGCEFVIANHFGYGVLKLLAGGWPDSGHASLTEGEFVADPEMKITEFDRLGYQEHKRKAHAWQKENYPEEYEQVERLSEMINKSRSDRT